MQTEELQRALRAEAEASPACVSVLWQELSGEPLFSYKPQRQMVAASMIKVPILTAALARVQNGMAALSQSFSVSAEDILDDSHAFETGAREATLEELLTWMIVDSDNTSTNVCINWLGMDGINAYCAALGLKNTRLQRRMLDFEAAEQGRDNYTSAEDMYRVFRALYENTMLTPALCAAARHILEKQRSSSQLMRYIWQDVHAGHKTGGLDYLSHDAGVFILNGRRWFLGVFTQDAPDVGGDQKLIGRVARRVFSHYDAPRQAARRAVVHCGIAPLYTQPSAESELADEALHGMIVELLARPLPGWYRVRTHYRYEGYVPEACLLVGDGPAQNWERQNKRVVTTPWLDVMKEPRVQAARRLGIPRGSVVCPAAQPPADGWQRLMLPGGETGYVKAAHLGEYVCTWDKDDEAGLRRRITESARAYLGVQYRWGGKTPQGIDCSGLAAMAYLLNGCVIFRDAVIKEGFAVREISQEALKPGDLLFFTGHVAIYLGGGEYIHATGRAGDDGVVLNSLRPGHPRYREDLHKGIKAAGSVF